MPDAQPLNAAANLKWADTPVMDSQDFHNAGAQEWRYDANGVYLQADPQRPLRTDGDPDTVTAILGIYGSEIFSAATTRRIPPELIVMTIAVETAMFRNVNFTGPKTFRWEQGVSSYSAGPMQILESTALDVIAARHLVFGPEDTPPHFARRPDNPPSTNPLYDGDTNITLGVDEIGLHLESTGLDPILVAARYNRGSLQHTQPSQDNPWGLVTTGDHLNRAAAWYGDACAVLSSLRQGKTLDTNGVIDGPALADAEDTATEEFSVNGLTPAEAAEQAADFADSGADVLKIPEEGGFFTLVITYPRPVAAPDDPPAEPAPGDVAPPDIDGYVICIERRKAQGRVGKTFKRTVGEYQAFFNRQPIPEIHGNAVERQGPGDNSNSGVTSHARLKAGTYPLFTHAGASAKYRTFGFANPGGLQSRPWPAVRIGSTGARTGVLIHCAAGYLMSIGCINLTGHEMRIGKDDIEYFDSRSRVIALIQSMKAHLGNQFPASNNIQIENAKLIIRGEP